MIRVKLERKDTKNILGFFTCLNIIIIPGLINAVGMIPNRIDVLGFCFYIFPLVAGWLFYNKGKDMMAKIMVLCITLSLILLALWMYMPFLGNFLIIPNIFAFFSLFYWLVTNRKGIEYERNG